MNSMNATKIFLVLFFVIFFLINQPLPQSAAESIKITYSENMDDVIFDGKWTFFGEWKRTSLNELTYDNENHLKLRTAHQDNYIYVFIDAITDTSLDRLSDRAMVCIDAKNDKTAKPNLDDYCFVVALASKSSFVLQGGSPLTAKSNFKKIPNPEGFIGISMVSDKNDRYTKIPHPSYEFRIPTDLVGRSNNYGFYIQVFDANKNEFYSWPQYIKIEKPFKIPSPSSWGNLVSLDKSLPEFKWPLLLFLPAFISIILITKLRKNVLT